MVIRLVSASRSKHISLEALLDHLQPLQLDHDPASNCHNTFFKMSISCLVSLISMEACKVRVYRKAFFNVYNLLYKIKLFYKGFILTKNKFLDILYQSAKNSKAKLQKHLLSKVKFPINKALTSRKIPISLRSLSVAFGTIFLMY